MTHIYSVMSYCHNSCLLHVPTLPLGGPGPDPGQGPDLDPDPDPDLDPGVHRIGTEV